MTANQEDPPQSVALQTRHTVLRPITPDRYGDLYHAELDGRLAGRWRFRGTPRPEEYASALWAGVYAQYLAFESQGSGQAPVGLVSAYNVDHTSGVAYVGAIRFAQGAVSSAFMIEAIGCFVDYLFRTTTLRKLYFETAEYNLAEFGSAIRLGVLLEEARLRANRYFDGRYWDTLFLVLERDHWESIRLNVPGLET